MISKVKVESTRIHEDVTQFHVQFAINKISSHAFELFFEQRMAETESCTGKFSENCRITSWIVTCNEEKMHDWNNSVSSEGQIKDYLPV